MKEDYVSFEIAKLLKEKGFDGYCFMVYDKYGAVGYTMESYGEATICNSECSEGDISAPTLQMSMKWLREVHELHICIFVGKDSSCDADGNLVDVWHFWSYKITNLCGDMIYDAYDKLDCAEYQSYEESCEDAIKHCLNYIIK